MEKLRDSITKLREIVTEEGKNKENQLRQARMDSENIMEIYKKMKDEISSESSDIDFENREDDENSIQNYIVKDGTKDNPEYNLNEERFAENERNFLLQMLHYEEMVGRKLYCIRTSKFNKEYSFSRRGDTDIKTYENPEENKYSITVVSDIYAITFEQKNKKEYSSIFYRRLTKKINQYQIDFLLIELHMKK